jgi:siroheme synthase
LRAQLSRIADVAAEHGLRAPAVTVIGAVSAFARESEGIDPVGFDSAGIHVAGISDNGVSTTVESVR